MSNKKKEEEKIDVEYLTSLALAFPVDGEVKHFQITIVRETASKKFRMYFDVVDPSKIKLAEE